MTAAGSFMRGLYADAEAIAATPDYARRLARECGVNTFVVRTGFDPNTVAPRLDEAVAVLRALGVRVVFLVGAWWGAGLTPAPELRMRVAPVASGYAPGPAHEARWPMLTPGPETCGAIGERIGELCARHAPEGICLTHARFHHAADIAGLWETGATPSFAAALAAAGLAPGQWVQAFETAEARLAEMNEAAVLAAVECGEVGVFLDELAGGDVLTRWLDLRCSLIAETLGDLFGPLRARFPRTQFGTNAIAPLFSRASGQDYAALAKPLDFIQPLLGYIEWHVAQTVRQWAGWLRFAAPQLSESGAFQAAGALFGLDAGASRLLLTATVGEGSLEVVVKVLSRQIAACARVSGFERGAIQPVLRGKDWPVEIAAEAEASLRESGFGGVFYQGSAFLGGPPPVSGWN